MISSKINIPVEYLKNQFHKLPGHICYSLILVFFPTYHLILVFFLHSWFELYRKTKEDWEEQRNVMLMYTPTP